MMGVFPVGSEASGQATMQGQGEREQIGARVHGFGLPLVVWCKHLFLLGADRYHPLVYREGRRK